MPCEATFGRARVRTHPLMISLSLLVSPLLVSCNSNPRSGAHRVISMDYSAGRPTVQVMINGAGPYPFVLDTGAPEGVIDRQLVESLNLPVVGVSEIGDGTVLEQTDRVRVASLEVDSSRFSDVDFDLFDLRGTFHSEFYGVIGMSVFWQFLVTIDYTTQEIKYREGALHPDQNGVVHYEPDKGLFLLRTKIGGVETSVHLDSGSSSGFTVPEIFSNELQFVAPREEAGKATTVGRELQLWSARLNGNIELADLVYRNPTLTIIDGMEIGQIGHEVLKALVVTLDQQNQLIKLERPEQ